MKDTTEIGERELHTVNSWPESLFQLGLGISTCGVSTSTIHDFSYSCDFPIFVCPQSSIRCIVLYFKEGYRVPW